MRRFVAILAVTMAGGLALTGSAATPARALLPSALLPITDADQTSMTESGCTQSFSQGNDTYLYAIGRTMLMRTAAGLNRCPVTEAQFQNFGTGRTTLSCGGRQLVLRPVGRSTPNQATDSNGGDATLTMTQGGHSRTVRGTWGVAC